MAKSDTTYHAFQKPASTADVIGFDDDFAAVKTYMDEALATLGAYQTTAANAIGSSSVASNAGKIISSAAGARFGRVIGLAAAADATLIFQDHPADPTTGTDKFVIGYDDSSDGFAINNAATINATLANNAFSIDSSGNVTFANNVTITGAMSLAPDLTLYEAVNDANPEILLGSTTADELHIQAVYDSGAQTLDYVLFQTDSANGVADKGAYKFNVDGTEILDIDDGGIDLITGMTYDINGTTAISATGLGSAVVGSSLTSVGTLTSLTMGGDIALTANDLTTVGDIFFDSVTGEIAGIQNTDLVDKSVVETITGVWTFSTQPVFSTTTSFLDEIIYYDAVNDGNPQIRIGSADAEELHIQAVYDSGAQTLDYVLFQTDTAGASSNDGLFRFNVDGLAVLDIDDGGINLVTGRALSINGTDVLGGVVLGSTIVTSSLTAVGALASGSITTGFGTIDTGTSNITTGGQFIIDSDGSVGSNGSITVGTGSDTSLYFDGTDFVIDSNGGSAGGIKLDSGDNTVEILAATTSLAVFNTVGLNLVSAADVYRIASTTVLGATALGSGVLASSLTSVGTLASLAVGSDVTIYEPTNDANPRIFLGASGSERMSIQAVYDIGAQTLNYIQFDTNVVSGTDDKGLYQFLVDNSAILDIRDDGLNLDSGKVFSIAGTEVLNNTTLASGVTLSSLTTVGTLSALTMGGTIVMGDNDITGVKDITFTDNASAIAGIVNGNLVDKSATETIAGTWTMNAIVAGGNIVMGDNSMTGVDTITFTDTAGTIASIQNQNLLDKSTAETVSGDWIFTGVLTITQSATPTVTAAGEIALDTTVTDWSHGIIRYYGGEEMFLVAMPVANLVSPGGGEVVAYNSTNDEFELVAAGGSGDVTAGAVMTDHSLVRGDGGAKGIQDSGILIDDSDNISAIGTLAMGGNLTIYEAVNDGNPIVSLGSSTTNELFIQAVYNSGVQTLDYVLIQTDTASATANDGLLRFNVDGTNILDIDDGGIDLDSGMGLSIAGTDVLVAATLGSGVLASSLTSVGTLSGLTMGGNIVMADNSVTGVDTITFTDTAGTIASIQNQNLLDKSATETVSGTWTFSGTSVDVQGTMAIGGGQTPDANNTLVIDRDFTSTGAAATLSLVGLHTVTGGTSTLAGAKFDNSFTLNNNLATHGIATQIFVDEPQITKTAGDITWATTVYVDGRPSEGDKNAGILITQGDSTITPSTGANALVIENAGDVGMSILTINNDNANIYFGSDGVNNEGLIQWNGTTDDLRIGTNVTGGELKFYVNTNDLVGTIASNGDVTLTGDLLVDGSLIGITADPNLMKLASTELQINGDLNLGTPSSWGAEDLTITATTSAGMAMENTGSGALDMHLDSNRSTAGADLMRFRGYWNGTEVASIHFRSGVSTTPKDDGDMIFRTSETGGTISTKMELSHDGGLWMRLQASDPTPPGNSAGIFAKDVSTSAELFAIGEDTVATQISPHDPITGQWYHHQYDPRKDTTLIYWMERFIDDMITLHPEYACRWREEFSGQYGNA